MNTLKKTNITKLGGITFLLASIIFLGSCNQEKLRTAEQQQAELQKQLTQTETTVNELMQTFNDVENNLSEIRTREGLINLDSQNPELSANKRDKIIADIQSINKLMDENRQKIADLQKQLSKSGLKIANLDKKLQLLITQLGEKEKDLEELKGELTARDFHIASLNSSIDTLHNTVAKRDTLITTQASEIAALDKNLFTTYFTEGTYQELKEKGVIANDGWTPWDGRKLELNENLSPRAFTEIDKRETTSIPVNSKKASLVSDHPEGSYTFQKNEEGMIASLEINNPDEFWKISDYLVLEVK